MRIIHRILLLGIAAGLLGCSKEEAAPISSTANIQQSVLQEGNWRLVGYLYEATPKAGGSTTKIDYFPRLACQKDDLFSFRADKQLLWNTNKMICENAVPSVTTWSTWDLTADDTQLILNRDGHNYFPFNLNGRSSYPAFFQVAKLTTEAMVLQSSMTRAPDSVITITYSFMKE